ncbi:hypothetical protein ZPR_1272 [Zunongwangia profunda SM-A87]|uniref:Uncharacterized protein n=1 Tax=Zunongwangia profunda (strain DSM 18752 / CCTCC AB 206139 / SM-A87) TaxID=655815 RepID=D5BJE4_ZUNPS|nr:hypothetical protein ZPR_1272 [Zunongwangia profunda SM-A87]
MGNMDRMVLEISLTESSIPPIWANREVDSSESKLAR